MKTPGLILALGLMFAAAAAPAQNFNIAKQQARNAADGPTPPPPLPGSPAATAVNPALAATLQNISNLGTDIAALLDADAANPDAALKMPLLNDLVQAAQGAKPSKESLQKFADAFTTAVAGKKSLHDQQARLGQWLHALCNCSHLTDTQQATLTTGLQKILAHAGVAKSDADNVIEAIKAVAAQTK